MIASGSHSRIAANIRQAATLLIATAFTTWALSQGAAQNTSSVLQSSRPRSRGTSKTLDRPAGST